ncbi:hypothetical protein WA538_001125 [Blastocystis sp. DL]
MNPEKYYVETEYWNKRYEEEKEPFEWVAGYDSIKQYDIERFVHKDDAILFTGCGSSRLSRDMYCDGFHNLTAIDISEVAIRQCQERDKEYPQIKYQAMDCFQMTFPPASFDSVIDKSTMDTFFCSETLLDKIPQYLDGVAKVLKKGSYFLIVSFNEPKVFEMVANLADDLQYEMAMRRCTIDQEIFTIRGG